MEKAIDKPNIWQRIVAVRKDVAYVRKDVEVRGKQSYKAVSHDAIVAHLRKSMNLHGIGFYCQPDHDIPKEEVQFSSGTKGTSLYGNFVASFVNIDNPEDRFTVSVIAQSIDTSDKAPGKLHSYAKKYALRDVFLLETGENEESRGAEFDEVTIELVLADVAIALQNEEPEKALELADSAELSRAEKNAVWKALNSAQKKAMRDATQARARKIREKANG